MSKKGFSLIELLVVMAILTILMGLVVPKVGRMMDEAKEHKCRNNLKQLHAAVMSHINDNNGKLPRAMSFEMYYSINERFYERPGWVAWKSPTGSLNARWPESGPSAETSQENGMVQDGGMGEGKKNDIARLNIEYGTLYEYMNESMEHYACPLIKREKEKEGTVYRTYAMNGFFHSSRTPAWDPRFMTRIGTAESIEGYTPEAAKLLLFAEVEPTMNTYKHSGADPRNKKNDKRATATISGDCCIFPPEDNSKSDIVYGVHRSPIADKKASLAVFLDGHIEKIFPENSDGKNIAWFYARGLDPEEPLP